MRIFAASPSLRRWPLLGLATLLLALTATLAAVWAGTNPADAQDSSEVPAKPAGLRIITEPGLLDVALGWDDVDGASHYWVRWRSVDTGEKLNDGIEVETPEAGITVAGHGDWVARVQACNDAGCGKPLAQRFTVEPAPQPTPTPEPTPEPQQSVPGSPTNLSVAATPGQLDLWATWDALDDADSYILTWRRAGGDFEAGNAATVTANSADFTVSGYGQWVVRLAGCNDAGCGPSVERAVGIAPGRPANLAVSVARGELNLSATWDALEGATLYKLSWLPAEGDTPPDRAAWAATTNAVWVSTNSATFTVSDYGQWFVRLEGCNDAGCGPAVFQQLEVEPPNRAPVVSTQAANYADFTYQGNAPRGILVSKRFHGIFSDPDGDDLTYSVSIPENHLPLVDTLQIHPDGQSDSQAAQSDRPMDHVQRVFFTADAEGDWKAITPALADPLIITATLTATDPEGLSASVSGDFLINWESGPELPGEPQNFAVSVEPGRLDVLATWDEVEGATSYQLRWRESGGEFEAANAVTVTDTSATITVSGYGEWEVRLQACNAAGCGPEASQTVETTAPELRLNLAPARDANGKVRPRIITAFWEPVEGATSYTLRWRRTEANSQTQGQDRGTAARNSTIFGGALGVLNNGGQGVNVQSGNDQGENRLDLSGDQTSADIPVPDDGAYEAELQAMGDGSGVINRGRSTMEMRSQAQGHLFIWEQDECYYDSSQINEWIYGRSIDAYPIDGGLQVRWREDNAPVTKWQYSIQDQGLGRDRHSYTTYDPAPKVFWQDIPGGDVAEHTFTDLKNGTTYAVLLRAVIYGRACLAWVVFVTPSDPTIGPPAGLSAAVDEYHDFGRIRLTWDHPGDASLSYDIQYKELSRLLPPRWRHYATIYPIRLSNGKLHAIVQGLTNGHYDRDARYGFRLRARRGGNEVGPYSEPAYMSIGRWGSYNGDTLTGGDGDDRLYGRTADDTLIGNGGNDRLSGQSDNDTLRGGPGDDTLVGGYGADELDGGPGTDTADYARSRPGFSLEPLALPGVTVNLATGVGSDGEAQGDTLTGIENLTGSDFEDTLTGDAADNILRGGPLGDALDGAGGSDTADYTGSNAAVSVNLATGAVSGGHAQGDTLTSIENLIGTDYDDTLTGNAADNAFRGGAGSDTLDGADGSDTADYTGSDAGVTVNLTTGAVSGGHAQGDTLTSIENLTGSAHADTLTGTISVNILLGRGGDDTLRGDDGDDTLRGGDGNDWLYGGGGGDTLDGGDGNDWLYGGGGSDTLDGGDGADTAHYTESDAGVTINLATGVSSGGHAQGDTLISIAGLAGSDYADTLTGNAFANLLIGHGGNDTLIGGDGGDHLHGEAGNDTLHGDDGNDWLYGDGGNDTLHGGSGSDVFAFRLSQGLGTDTIEDYTLGSDKIYLCTQYLGGDFRSTYADVGSDYVITVTRDGQVVGTITVKGITSQSPNFDKLNIRRYGNAWGSCWGGPVYPPWYYR